MTLSKIDSTESKRACLRILGLLGMSASAVPDRWIKPVISIAVVPAHAQMTGCAVPGIALTSFNVEAPSGEFAIEIENTTDQSLNFDLLFTTEGGTNSISFSDTTGAEEQSNHSGELAGTIEIGTLDVEFETINCELFTESVESDVLV